MSNMNNNNDIIHRLRNHTPAIDSTLIEDAIKYIWNLEDQRDLARKEYCIAEAENDMYDNVMSSPALIAEECGWEDIREFFNQQENQDEPKE